MRHFKETEFRCPCCKLATMNPVFLDMIDDAREYAEIPFVITSGYRCPQHNAEIGGAPNSAHMRGLAADIACATDEQRWQIVMGCVDANFTRIFIGKGHVHVDCDSSLPGPCMGNEKGVM